MFAVEILSRAARDSRHGPHDPARGHPRRAAAARRRGRRSAARGGVPMRLRRPWAAAREAGHDAHAGCRDDWSCWGHASAAWAVPFIASWASWVTGPCSERRRRFRRSSRARRRTARSGCCSEPAFRRRPRASAVADESEGSTDLCRARGAPQIQRLTYRSVLSDRESGGTSMPIAVVLHQCSKEEDDDGNGKA